MNSASINSSGFTGISVDTKTENPSPTHNINGSVYHEDFPIDTEIGASFSTYQANDVHYKTFPIDNNQYVDKWLIHFSQGEGRKHMRRYLERSTRYTELMKIILERQGLPGDLMYMSMAESGFNPTAKSSANAVGYWQFMKPTGLQYGLKIDSHIDERQDFVLSTNAAAKYLKDLYGIFGDWRLSMAAYNYGQDRVKRAISQNGSRNFWYLKEKKAFPDETRNYVPKIMAMRKIALNPEAYGFVNLNYKSPLNYGLVSLDAPSSLSDVSEYLNIPHSELKVLNSKFKTDYIPVQDQKSYIRIPANVL